MSILFVEPLGHDGAHLLHGIVQRAVGSIERGHAQAQVVGTAEVKQDVPLLQCQRNAQPFLVRQRQVRAAPVRLQRRAQLEAKRLQIFLAQLL